jgi:hypothetical protein
MLMPRAPYRFATWGILFGLELFSKVMMAC